LGLEPVSVRISASTRTAASSIEPAYATIVNSYVATIDANCHFSLSSTMSGKERGRRGCREGS
jgi:hypothetical protein